MFLQGYVTFPVMINGIMMMYRRKLLGILVIPFMPKGYQGDKR